MFVERTSGATWLLDIGVPHAHYLEWYTEEKLKKKNEKIKNVRQSLAAAGGIYGAPHLVDYQGRSVDPERELSSLGPSGNPWIQNPKGRDISDDIDRPLPHKHAILM